MRSRMLNYFRFCKVQPYFQNQISKFLTYSFSHLNEALPASHLQLVGSALKEMGAYTQAAIAFYYANEKNESFNLINMSDRWDCLESWYQCIRRRFLEGSGLLYEI